MLGSYEIKSKTRSNVCLALYFACPGFQVWPGDFRIWGPVGSTSTTEVINGVLRAVTAAGTGGCN